MPGPDGKENVCETGTVITTLLDHQAAPAEAVRETYLTRWGAGDHVGRGQTTIAGAGNRTSGPVLRSGSPRLVIQEAWAWLTAGSPGRRGRHAPRRGGRRPRAAQEDAPGHRRRGACAAARHP